MFPRLHSARPSTSSLGGGNSLGCLVVLLGEAKVLAELGVDSLHARVAVGLRLLDTVPVSLLVLVVSGVVL